GRRWHEAALARARARADALVVPSAPVAAQLSDAGFPGDAVHRLPWGADHLPAPDAAGAAALLRRLGVAGGYLLTAGTLEPRKNLARLVAAYAAARGSLPEPWPLVVVGPSGWGASGLADAGVPDGVAAAGPVADGVLAALYAGARAFAYVPLTEGFGFPPVEAMVAGVPVVASTSVPSVDPAGTEVVRATRATLSTWPVPAGSSAPALRVDPFSVEEIAGALVTAAADEGARAALVRRGADWVAPMTWRRSARAHAALWEHLG
ncbi:MAG: glycosyltransferase, partial [Acidimicrobiales bacterium]